MSKKIEKTSLKKVAGGKVNIKLYEADKSWFGAKSALKQRACFYVGCGSMEDGIILMGELASGVLAYAKTAKKKIPKVTIFYIAEDSQEVIFFGTRCTCLYHGRIENTNGALCTFYKYNEEEFSSKIQATYYDENAVRKIDSFIPSPTVGDWFTTEDAALGDAQTYVIWNGQFWETISCGNETNTDTIPFIDEDDPITVIPLSDIEKLVEWFRAMKKAQKARKREYKDREKERKISWNLAGEQNLLYNPSIGAHYYSIPDSYNWSLSTAISSFLKNEDASVIASSINEGGVGKFYTRYYLAHYIDTALHTLLREYTKTWLKEFEIGYTIENGKYEYEYKFPWKMEVSITNVGYESPTKLYPLGPISASSAKQLCHRLESILLVGFSRIKAEKLKEYDDIEALSNKLKNFEEYDIENYCTATLLQVVNEMSPTVEISTTTVYKNIVCSSFCRRFFTDNMLRCLYSVPVLTRGIMQYIHFSVFQELDTETPRGTTDCLVQNGQVLCVGNPNNWIDEDDD